MEDGVPIELGGKGSKETKGHRQHGLDKLHWPGAIRFRRNRTPTTNCGVHLLPSLRQLVRSHTPARGCRLLRCPSGAPVLHFCCSALPLRRVLRGAVCWYRGFSAPPARLALLQAAPGCATRAGSAYARLSAKSPPSLRPM
ncbi:hypothetical protein NDU88_000355 [Pleurodeles waltl]|uniref:Uncharacterized protein n=1 Tax=Pleurodeles waltl TaxID=8319 RepID=A0AAV7TFE4_PLEWA|nr:hypothetical protein NDU88_000355 [Pleurodeles waltl]